MFFAVGQEECFKFGFIGQSPKCKMQNAKCKIRERRDDAASLGKIFPIGDNNFWDVESQILTTK